MTGVALNLTNMAATMATRTMPSDANTRGTAAHTLDIDMYCTGTGSQRDLLASGYVPFSHSYTHPHTHASESL